MMARTKKEEPAQEQEIVQEAKNPVEDAQEAPKEPEHRYSIEDAKDDICKLIHDRVEHMMRGVDRANDPAGMRALAELYTAIK